MHWNEFATDGSKSDLVDRRWHAKAASALSAHEQAGSSHRAESLGGQIMRLAQIATAMHLGGEAAMQCADGEASPMTGGLGSHAEPQHNHPCRHQTQESA